MRSFSRKPVDWTKIIFTDDSKFDRISLYYLFSQSLFQFQDKYSRYPHPYNADDYELIKNFIDEMNNDMDEKVDYDENILKKLCFTSAGDLCPVV